MYWQCGTSTGHRPGRYSFRNVTTAAWQNGSFVSSEESPRKVSTTGSGNCAARWKKSAVYNWYWWNLRFFWMICYRPIIGVRTWNCLRLSWPPSWYWWSYRCRDPAVWQSAGWRKLILFYIRWTDRIKALYCCGDGYILLYKWLSNGRFQWLYGCWFRRASTGSWKVCELSRKQHYVHLAGMVMYQSPIIWQKTISILLQWVGKTGCPSIQWRVQNPVPLLYSMVEKVKANGIDPYDYLFYVLSVLPYLWKSISHESLATLLTWNREVQQRYSEEAQTEPELTSIWMAGSQMDPATNICQSVRLLSVYEDCE